MLQSWPQYGGIKVVESLSGGAKWKVVKSPELHLHEQINAVSWEWVRSGTNGSWEQEEVPTGTGCLKRVTLILPQPLASCVTM